MIRAWRLAEGAWVETERPSPTPGSGDVAVAVEAFALGPPELGASTAGRAALAPGSTEAGDVIAGGAGVGVVSAAGDAATHLVGARVIVGPVSPCGECDVCRRGNAFVCPSSATLGVSRDGTMAESVIAAARWVCRVDGDLTVPGPAAALLPREAAGAYALYARAGVSPGEPVIVVGSGAVARFVSDIARARGCNPTNDGDAEPTQKPRRIFETTGTARGRATAIALANPGATVALYASPAPAPADIDPLIALDATIVGVAGAHPDLFPEVAALAVKNDLDLPAAAHIVTTADDIADALSTAGQNGKAVVVRVNA